MAMSMPNMMPTPPPTKGKRPLRHLTATDKIEAIQRIHDGESKASVARDIGVPESTLRGWCKNEEKLRYMSRQSQENAAKLGDSSMGPADFLSGPPDKRMKLDPSAFFVNGKLKYDELSRYQGRPSLGGLDLSGDKRGGGMDLGLGGLGGMGDYSGLASLNNSKGNKDMSRNSSFNPHDLSKAGDGNKTDLSMAAISPLTSLSHLSGISGLGQSPLALSFNDIATNLNLLAQLNNPGLSISGLGGMGSNKLGNGNGGNIMSTRPPKGSQSPRTENDKSPSLTVKNLAKLQQKGAEDLSGMAALLDKHKKSKGGGNTPPVDDALWYWLKSQQAMLGLNNIYGNMPPRPSSPQGSSSPQPSHPQSITKIPTPPMVASSPQETPPTSSTPDEAKQQSSWFWQWYKNFGSSMTPDKPPSGMDGNHPKSPFDNILYSHLTKRGGDGDNGANNNSDQSQSSTPKPEDLSSNHPPENTSAPHSPVNSDADTSDSKHAAKVKEELDNVLYNNNNNLKDDASDADDSIKSSLEALEHGEKFLKWLEACSDPSVTAMQVMQFRLLISSLKMSAERGTTVPSTGVDDKPKARRRK